MAAAVNSSTSQPKVIVISKEICVYVHKDIFVTLNWGPSPPCGYLQFLQGRYAVLEWLQIRAEAVHMPVASGKSTEWKTMWKVKLKVWKVYGTRLYRHNINTFEVYFHSSGHKDHKTRGGSCLWGNNFTAHVCICCMCPPFTPFSITATDLQLEVE